MQKFLFIIFLLFSVGACTPTSEASTWPWTFPFGITLNFPSEWQLVRLDFGNPHLQDSSGFFSIWATNRGNAVIAESDFRETDAAIREITLAGNIRALRKEFIPDNALYGGELIVNYLVIFPSGTFLGVGFPKTNNIEERERLFQTMLLSVHEPQIDTIAFFGGYGGLSAYPDNYEFLAWSSSDAPQFKNGENRLNIYPYARDFILALNSPEEVRAMTYVDVALKIIRFPFWNSDSNVDESLLLFEDFSDVSLVTYRPDTNWQLTAFSVDELMWFRFDYNPEDEAVIQGMIQSIIETYHFSDLKAHIAIPQIEPSAESTEE